LHVDDSLYELLSRLGDELRFVLLTSRADLQNDSAGEATDIEGLRVTIKASDHSKCERCWHHREDVGQHAVHTDLCGRCVENVEGAGEARQFA
jgi:isoleucyl-tRNA synthetase